MSQPTTGIGFSPSTPAAPSGNQNAVPQSNNATPQQAVSFYVPPATDSLLGVVQPDNDTITINEDGVISAVAGGATAAEVQQQAFTYAADTGSANAYAVSLSPTPSLVAGSVVVFKAANANTGASTLAVNGGSAIAITKSGTTALAGGEISTGQIVTVVYDGTEFQLQGGSSGGGSVYFGQGDSVAGSGDNLITLGSTPMSNSSVSVYVNGAILQPSTSYTISSNVITLSDTLSPGDIVVVNWATASSTPGGISLSGTISPPTGMNVWYSADAITGLSDGDTVSSWPDSSGNGNAAIAYEGGAIYHTAQINGLPAVTLGGGPSFNLTTAIAAGSGYTCFVVMSNISTSSKGPIIGGGAESFQYWSCASSKQQGADSTAVVQLGSGTAAADTSWHQMNVVMVNSSPGPFSISFRLDESADTTEGPSSGSCTETITEVGYNAVGHGNLDAQLAELIFYNSALTLGEIEAVEAYLNSKYGI